MLGCENGFLVIGILYDLFMVRFRSYFKSICRFYIFVFEKIKIPNLKSRYFVP
jgi:hypothetical protein